MLQHATRLLLALCASAAVLLSCGPWPSSKTISVVTTGTTEGLPRGVLTAADVTGHVVTPDYFECLTWKIHFLDLSKATTAATIAAGGNDDGVLRSFFTRTPGCDEAQAVFRPGIQNNIIDSISGGLYLEPGNYQCVIIQRMWSGYINVDADASGMTDYMATGSYQAHRDGDKHYLTITPHSWIDSEGAEYDVSMTNYIVLVDRELLQKYFFLNLPLATAAEVFDPDGTLKPSVNDYEQLTDAEKELVSYIAVTTANVWGADENGLSFTNDWMASSQQPFSTYLFIPSNPVDLSDLGSHSGATITISWDLTDLVYETIVPATTPDPSVYSTYIDFKNLEDPYVYDYDPANGDWASVSYQWRTYFRDDGGGDYVAVEPDAIGDLPPGTQLYLKKPYLWEMDPVTGPMGWTVEVTYTDGEESGE